MRCDNILTTDATQVRVKLSKETIDQYREEIETGAIMPPVVVFAEKNSEHNILADGHHRLYAHVHACLEEIEVDLREGNRHDALEWALQANRSHGLRMTNADKVKSVKMALADTELGARTQQEIADICNVTRQTVNRIGRRELLDEIEQEDVTKLQGLEENSPDNIRPTRPAPTQSEVERDELRQALSLIKALPYGGEDAIKLNLNQDDIKDLDYVSEWTAQAALATFHLFQEMDVSHEGGDIT